MRTTTGWTIVVAAAVSLGACKGKSDKDVVVNPTACGPATVRIGGVPMTIHKTLAVMANNTYVVHAFNHEKVTCAQVLAPMRRVAEGEHTFRLSAEQVGNGVQAVGFDSYTHMGDEVKVRTVKKPAAVGDSIDLCLPPVEFIPNVGEKKPIRASGLFSGEYCGERSQRL